MTRQDEQIYDSPTGWVAEHVRAYVASGGERGHVVQGLRNLLLTTRGRTTGRLRRTALVYARDGRDYVVIASNGGGPVDPHWYRNLVAEPKVELQVGAERFPAVARQVDAQEYPRLWQLILDIMPWCADMPQAAGRHIPLVRLVPALPEEFRDDRGKAAGAEKNG